MVDDDTDPLAHDLKLDIKAARGGTVLTETTSCRDGVKAEWPLRNADWQPSSVLEPTPPQCYQLSRKDYV